MNHEPTNINKDVSRKIQLALSSHIIETTRDQESVSIWFVRSDFMEIRTAMFKYAFPDSAWDRGYVTFALGSLVSLYSPNISN